MQKVISDSEARELDEWVDETPELQDEVKTGTKTFFVSRVDTENAGATCENKHSPPPL